MRIGVWKERKTQEYRVALTPEDCKKVVAAGHEVHLETTAGEGAGFTDADYMAAGASIAPDLAALCAGAEVLVGVKEPQKEHLAQLKSHHTLFCYLHLAAEPDLVAELQTIGLKAVAFETVEENGATPLLSPMSEVAGKLSVDIGTHYLRRPNGGKGVLLGGAGVSKATGHVVVVGLGVAGKCAAERALGLGAKVSVLDINAERLKAFKAANPAAHTIVSTPESVAKAVAEADVLVGAVYVVGKRAPTVVTATMVEAMEEGSVAVDISIDQGGCIETSRPCTHDMPVFVHKGVIHSAITNMPGAVPRTSSQALSAAITPYLIDLANGNWTPALQKGVNVEGGQLKVALN